MDRYGCLCTFGFRHNILVSPKKSVPLRNVRATDPRAIYHSMELMEDRQGERADEEPLHVGSAREHEQFPVAFELSNGRSESRQLKYSLFRGILSTSA